MRPLRRPRSLRSRLTMLYAGAFLLAGALLIVLMYLYMDRALGATVTAKAIGTKGDVVRKIVPADAERVIRGELAQAHVGALRTMLIASLVALAVIAVIAGALGWLLAGRAMNPLQKVTDTARRVADRNLHERIALDGPQDEIKDLADTFDAMLERLDRSFDGQRRFVANASHELRTPLTINRTLLEVAVGRPDATDSIRQLATTLLAVNERHERLIDGLLVLASSEATVVDACELDLADVASHVAQESRQAAADAGISIGVDARQAPTSGDPILLERLTQNLVDNAIRYNLVSNGWIHIATESTSDRTVLTVSNSGQRIPRFDVPGLFEPFRRMPGQERIGGSSGAGLGLSIVRSIATAHGGQAQARARDDGGLRVRISLPLSPGRTAV